MTTYPESIAEQLIAGLKAITASGGDPIAAVNQIHDAIVNALLQPVKPTTGGEEPSAVGTAAEQVVVPGTPAVAAPAATSGDQSRDDNVEEEGVLVREAPAALLGIELPKVELPKIEIDWEAVKEKAKAAILKIGRSMDERGTWPDGTSKEDTDTVNDIEFDES